MSTDNTKPLVSIIIPSYGRAEKIGNAINSIPNSPKVEIIVVDDNGLDSKNQKLTQEKLSEFIESNRIIYFPLEKNSGACSARNLGVEKASGEFIGFLDDDDKLLPEEFMSKVDYCVENKDEIDLCGSHMKVCFEGRFIDKSYDKFRAGTAREFLTNGNCYTPMILIKKESFIKVGGFSQARRYQDHVFMIKCYLNDLKIKTYDKDTFIHMVHNGERISNNYNRENPVPRINHELKLMDKLVVDPEVKRKILLEHQYLIFDECEHFSFKSLAFWTNHVLANSHGISELKRALTKVFIKMIPENIYLYIKYKFIF